MDDFVIAIPSYKRPDEQISLSYLKEIGIDSSRIYIFVQTEDDYRMYKDKWGNDAQVILKEAHSVSEARNNILDFFDGKCNVLMLDDDIKRLGKLDGDKLVEVSSSSDFDEIITKCFRVAGNGRIFGVYPCYNSFFMERSISTRVTVNTLTGYSRGYTIRIDSSLKAKEDIDMCGRILNSGGKVFRFNFLAVDAKHRTNEGGCKEVWQTDENEKASRRLALKYPQIFAVMKNKPSEVRVVCKDKKHYV